MFPGTARFEALEPRMLFAHPTFTVAFNDPSSSNQAYYSELRSTILSDGAAWGQFYTSSAQLDVEVDFSFDPSIRATGSSASQQFLRQDGNVGVYQAGAAAKIISGLDVNGSQPDIIFTVGTNYLANELWFDTTPMHFGVIPPDKTDAYSVFLHEMGHAFGINGYRDGTTGLIPGGAETTYDTNTSFDGSNFYFNGPTAVNYNGGPVPLTYGNISHVGNSSPRPGVSLVGDLMNGVVFNRGTRYGISNLDLAILQDTGLSTSVYPWTTITGQVFFDTNHNGAPNRREPGLAGWKVYVDLNNSGLPTDNDPTTITNANGIYTFTGLPAGRYIIRPIGKRHYTVTTPSVAYGIVRPKAGLVTSAANFGEYNVAVVSAVQANVARVAIARPTASLFSTSPIAAIPQSATSVFASKKGNMIWDDQTDPLVGL